MHALTFIFGVIVGFSLGLTGDSGPTRQRVSIGKLTITTGCGLLVAASS